MNMMSTVNFKVREHWNSSELVVVEMYIGGEEVDAVATVPSKVGEEMQEMFNNFLGVG